MEWVWISGKMKEVWQLREECDGSPVPTGVGCFRRLKWILGQRIEILQTHNTIRLYSYSLSLVLQDSCSWNALLRIVVSLITVLVAIWRPYLFYFLNKKMAASGLQTALLLWIVFNYHKWEGRNSWVFLSSLLCQSHFPVVWGTSMLQRSKDSESCKNGV